MGTTALVLFRRDLRLADNAALHAACESHAHILPVYVHAPAEEGDWPEGAASRWWLHHSLDALGVSLRGLGSDLQLYCGNTVEIVRKLARDAGVAAVYWNRRYEPAAISNDHQLKEALRADGIAVHDSNAALWCEPWQIETAQGTPYRVFTPYWKRLRPSLQATKPLPAPRLHGSRALPGALPLQALELLPRPTWTDGLAANWRPGEAGATEMLDVFRDDAVGDYARGRDLPARHGTSRLSPHLHFGEISPRQVHYALDRAAAGLSAERRPDLEPFLRQLGWREFAHHLLYHYPSTPVENFNSAFDGFCWAPADEVVLERWQQGRTGIPLVDAGMRELWHSGWMHNRVRMIVASFLAKNLRQHWLHGARWFWDTLVDADLANNTMGWQWVAGSGADAAPYFRVFNPVTQAKRFDPAADYLRRWLPELGDASPALLHEPWQDPGLLKRSGYPAPIVDLAISRTQALQAWQSRT